MNKKIGIVGYGCNTLAVAIAKHLDSEVELLSPRVMNDLKNESMPKVIEVPIFPAPKLNYAEFFEPPLTRAQRRKQQRKK